jgi:outer membrane protein OmpA-like peptidoglycan-associated protein
MKCFASVFTVAASLALVQPGAAQTRHVLPGSDSPRQASQSLDTGDDEQPPAAREPREKPTSGECRKSSAALTLTVDRKTVNLEEGRLLAKMDGPICSLTMQIIRKDATVVDKSFEYTGPEQELRWSPIPRDQIEKIEIRIAAKHNAYQAVALIPWFVKIDHQEVRFDTDKADIRKSEFPKLKDSLVKIKEALHKIEGKGLGTVTLFIAGHTDTRGKAEHNMALSRARAASIAEWFEKEGLCIPIAYEGFGETALRKVTADEVDEPANRRVDYILSVEPPVIKKGLTPTWKAMSKGCK